MKYLILLISGFSILLLSSCATSDPKVTPELIKAHREDYLRAQNGRDLVVPSPLSDYLISREFNVPIVPGQVGIEPTPPGRSNN